MADLDTPAIMDRFFDTFEEADPQILVENGPSQEIDATKPWMIFTVEPGAEQQVQTGASPRWQQLGVAILAIRVPRGEGSGPGDDIKDKFLAAFRSFRSADRCLRVYRTSTAKITPKDGPLEINVTIYWESVRTR